MIPFIPGIPGMLGMQGSQGMGAVLQRFLQFKQGFTGDAKQQVQQLLDSGRVTKEQYDNAVRMAEQLQQIFR